MIMRLLFSAMSITYDILHLKYVRAKSKLLSGYAQS